MELLIASHADVHRECGQMTSGRLVPLRFAARAQNEYGLETLQRQEVDEVGEVWLLEVDGWNEVSEGDMKDGNGNLQTSRLCRMDCAPLALERQVFALFSE